MNTLDPHTHLVIGANGFVRLSEFYEIHAREGVPSQVLDVAIENLEHFLSRYSGFPSTPSVFMDKGPFYFSLGWEDTEGSAIEVDISNIGFVLWLESTDKEYAFLASEVPQLLKMLPY